ncbi:alpha/beta fold hydrolase [Leucothrix arctica]|uniref:Alpha/beta hydrolase n=1 Tax=Leucothrix arctica TaxID=1481894 RepID=A0A317CK18_9GAMM|nr:alpha/beta fold hydrolase [Leucothrix arctica]PWQ96672.1 alpha/beta hydrolase [Leucothrix arctica]
MTNTQLNYKQFGDTNNPALFMLHGLLGSMDNWRGQAQNLSSHFNVITPDLRNHGHSPHLSGMRYKDMAEDVLSLAEDLGISSFDLLGHSMGGKVAMNLALNHSERLNKLIIVDIAPKSYPLWHLPIFNALLSLPVHEIKSRKTANDMLIDSIESSVERAFLLKNLKSDGSGGYKWRCDLSEITRTYLNVANFNATAGVTFDKPTLFIKGGQSPYLDPVEDQEKITLLFPQASIITIEDAGHLPHIESAETFSEQVNSFLGLS